MAAMAHGRRMKIVHVDQTPGVTKSQFTEKILFQNRGLAFNYLHSFTSRPLPHNPALDLSMGGKVNDGDDGGG